MFEDIMCLIGGFLCAYVIIRAVRSFLGGVGLVLLGLSLQSVQAQWITISNLTASAGTFGYYAEQGGSYYQGYNVAISGNSKAGEFGPYFGSGSAHVIAWYGSGPRNGANPPDGATKFYDQSVGYNEHVVAVWTGGQMYTNCIYSGVVSNLSSMDEEWFVVPGDDAITNRTWFTMPAKTYKSYFLQTTNNFGCLNFWGPGPVWQGDNLPVLKAQICPDCDPSYNPGPHDPPPGSSTNNPVNPDPDLGDVSNALGELGPLLRGIFNKLIGMDWNDVRAIKTNTYNTAASAAGILTNTLGILNNTSRSNLAAAVNQGMVDSVNQGMTNTGLSNVFSSFGTQYDAQSDAVSTNQGDVWDDTGVSGLSAGVTVWGTGVGGAPSAMSVTIGPASVQRTLNFSLSSVGTALWFKIVSVGPWVRLWLGFAITLALWWCCVAELFDRTRDAMMGAASSVRPSGEGVDSFGVATAIKYGARVAIATQIIVVSIGTIAAIPTAAVLYMTSHDVLNPQTMSGFFESISSVGDINFAAIMGEYAGMIMVWFPFETFFTAMVTWLGYYFSVQYWSWIVFGLLRLMGFLVPAIVLLLGTLELRGDQVRFENLSGSSVVLSNGPVVLTVPPGVTDDLVLDAGDWSCGTNVITIGEAGLFQVVRASGSTNAPGVYLSEEGGLSPYEWWVVGFNCGLVVFCFAWAVSSVRIGLLLRVRE